MAGQFDGEPKWVRFVTGGMASSTAEFCTLPIDTVKVRLQVQRDARYSGVLDTFRQVVRTEGVAGLYKGIAPAVLRQSVYSSIRMGVYEPIRELVSGGSDQPSFWQRLLAGGSAGGIGIAVANPTELVKIRMQADSAGTRYRGTVDAFRSIVRDEGVRGLWQGVGPNIQRAIIVNAVELGTYDHSKMMLVRYAGASPDAVTTHFGASFIAGFFAAAASSPVDVVKNRLMSQPAGAERLYSGMLDCATKTVRAEGFLALYKGFVPNWLRLGPWCVVMFMSYEQYRLAARDHVWK